LKKKKKIEISLNYSLNTTLKLRHIGVLEKSESGGFEKYKEVDSLFKNVWANNADAISIQYSGTGALKNDFTRTGKRDFRGVLNDGINSVTR